MKSFTAGQRVRARDRRGRWRYGTVVHVPYWADEARLWAQMDGRVTLRSLSTVEPLVRDGGGRT